MTERHKVLYTDTLNSFMLLSLFINRKKQFYKDLHTVCYLDLSSKLVLRLIKLLFSSRAITFEKISFHYVDLVDENNQSIGSLIDTIHLWDASKKIQNLIPFLKNNNHKTVNVFKSYFEKRIVNAGYQNRWPESSKRTLKETLLSIEAAAQHWRQNYASRQPFFLMESDSLIVPLSTYTSKKGFTLIKNINPFGSFIVLIRLWTRQYEHIQNNFLFRLKIFISKILLLTKKTWSSNNSIVIVDQTISTLKSGNFWQESPILPKRITFYKGKFTVFSVSLNEVQNLELKHGFPKSGDLDQQNIMVQEADAVQSSRNLDFILNIVKREFEFDKKKWQFLFHNSKAKIYLTHHRCAYSPMSATAAIQELGGISGMWQLSHQDVHEVIADINSDLYFSFSPHAINVEKKNSKLDYIISIGYIGDFRFPLVRKKSTKLRRQLLNRGAKRILSYFDENTVKDDRWFVGDSTIQDNYQFILEKLLENDWLGLVIKPKKPNTLRRRLGKVAPLLDRATATGRCYMYEQNYITPPVEAALASDLAIHDMLNGFTAGLEAALAGIPTLMFDSLGYLKGSATDKLPKDRVVFKDWNILWDSLVRHWNKEAIHGFGDWGELLDEEDPFRDGKAAERMTTYVNWLLEGFDQRLDREKNMALAAERYSEIWGNEYVIRM